MLPANKDTLLGMLKNIRDRGLPVEAESKIVRILTRMGVTVPPRP